MLEVIDLSPSLSKEDYSQRLKKLQKRVWQLQRACWASKVPTMLVLEGWDAAGKGTVIRRLTSRLEPRGYDLHHVTDEPRTHERDLPWMWRFWGMIPAYGSMAIYDRSWNRVAVEERVNGCDELRWRRALRDIGDFERTLRDDGYVPVKFFLHISREQQLERYDSWKEDPGTSWKALEGRWNKPRRYQQRLAATEELLQHTEFPHAPWHIIAATDRRWATVAVLEQIIETLTGVVAQRAPDIDRSLDDSVSGDQGGD